jgi:peptidoglycan-associated lipoprotein
MKLNRLATVLTLGLALTALVATGCKKGPDYMTNMPGRSGPSANKAGPVRDPGNSMPLVPGDGPGSTSITDIDKGMPPVARGSFEGWPEDPAILAAESIHFAFDSATVRKDDQAKLENVATYLKSNPANAVRIEGNCDKRGTEGYNMALGERRALAAREELVKLGIAPDRIDTRSYGEDRPVDPADNDAAYAKNRRDDFVVLTPPAR